MPFLARLEAVAGNRGAAVVVAVADLAHRVELHLVAREREQGVEREVPAAHDGQRRVFVVGDRLRARVAQLHRRRLRIAAEQRLRVAHGKARRFFLAVPGGEGERGRRRRARVRIRDGCGGRRVEARHGQHGMRGIGGVDAEAVRRGLLREQVILRPRLRCKWIRGVQPDAHAGGGVGHPFRGPVAAADLERMVAGADEHVGLVDAAALVGQAIVGAPAVEGAAHVEVVAQRRSVGGGMDAGAYGSGQQTGEEGLHAGTGWDGRMAEHRVSLSFGDVVQLHRRSFGCTPRSECAFCIIVLRILQPCERSNAGSGRYN